MTKIEMLTKEIQGKTIEGIIEYRDTFETNSEEWGVLNLIKAERLEDRKPSTKETIVYFDETDLMDIPEGFTVVDSLPNIPYKTERRSVLEYNSEQRHPIPYCLVKHNENYFFILREQGSGELRLIGKKGLLGGHVGEEDVNPLSLNKTILNALKREIHEEAGITDDMVQNLKVKGYIKTNNGVDADHLGIIYEVTLNTDAIKAEEDGVLSGIWIHETEISNHYESFESWSQIVYDNILKKS